MGSEDTLLQITALSPTVASCPCSQTATKCAPTQHLLGAQGGRTAATSVQRTLILREMMNTTKSR